METIVVKTVPNEKLNIAILEHARDLGVRFTLPYIRCGHGTRTARFWAFHVGGDIGWDTEWLAGWNGYKQVTISEFFEMKPKPTVISHEQIKEKFGIKGELIITD